MNAREAERLLPCHLPGDDRVLEAVIQKAIRFAETDEALKTRLNAQATFDLQVMAQIEAIQIPHDLKQRLASIDHGAHSSIWRSPPLKNPAVLAAVLSLIILAGLLIHSAMQRAEDFPGKEVALQMVDAAEEMSGVEFEPIEPTELGKLSDWFAMNGMDGFTVPREFAGLKAVGCRVFKQAGFPVAQALVEHNNMIVYVFNGPDLEIKLSPADKWRLLAADGRAAAIRGMDEMCFLVTFRGTEEQMRELLRSRLKK